QPLAIQFKLERQLGTQTLPAAPTLPGGPPARRISLARAGGRGPQPAEEVQTLLRGRLRFVAAVLSATFLAYALGFIGRLITEPLTLAMMSVLFVLSGGLAALLGTGRPLSLRQLRGLEAGLFASLVVFLTWYQVRFFPSELLW